MEDKLKKSVQHTVLIGVFLVLSSSLFVQCSQKEKSQISEEEWASLPADGPYLSAYEHIICSSEATKPELYAASEFQRLFKGFTGKELTIEKSDSKSGKVILIGAEAANSDGLQVNTEKMGEEGFKIEIAEDKLAIYGGRPRGTLYGVYEFFEQYCGVRYLTHDHTYYPEEGKDKEIRIKGRNYSYVPPFVYRVSHFNETYNNPAFAVQLRTNTVKGPEELGGVCGYSNVQHNVAYLVPPSVYGKEHPEYYALVKGERLLKVHGGGPQLCLTNPEVLEIVVKATLDAIEKNPEVKNFNIGQMDNGNYCTCESCAAIDAREESHAGTMLAFVNAVAERIEKIHPDVWISTFAYEYTRKPTKTIHTRDNVIIQLCSIECSNVHAIDDPSSSLNREFCEDMDNWKEKAENIFIWNYNLNARGYRLPFPNLRVIGKNVEYFVNNNVLGVFMQGPGDVATELGDLRNYVISRCLWKPGRDSWQETLDFCRMHYAESAQPMIDYLTYYHDLVEKSGMQPGVFPTESSLCINSEMVKRMDEYFTEAFALAKSEQISSRIEKASLSLLRAKLSASTMDLKYENGVCKPYLEDIDENLVEIYTELCEKYDVRMDNEYIKNETYLNIMRSLYAGMPAVLLENDLWRVMILPENNAKIVEMTYKPTGRDVTQPARALDRFRYEEWVYQGEGPKANNIVPFEVIEQTSEKTVLEFIAKDGAKIRRTISLADDAVYFETTVKANEARPFNINIHPEYDAGSNSYNPQEVSVYVKAEEWLQANQGWVNAKPTDEQSALIKEGLKGGGFAYFNHKLGFGVEQRFNPDAYSSMNLFWSPERIQINLEMTPVVKTLKAGEQAKFSYEVHYLDKAPETL